MAGNHWIGESESYPSSVIRVELVDLNETRSNLHRILLVVDFSGAPASGVPASGIVESFGGSMDADNERHRFSERLKWALIQASYRNGSPTLLAQEFNARYHGRPVTVHAARKWLVGEAIPSREKLRALSLWLGVPAEWLRFGDADVIHLPEAVSQPPLKSGTTKLLNDLLCLDDHHRKIAREFIRMLVKVCEKH